MTPINTTRGPNSPLLDVNKSLLQQQLLYQRTALKGNEMMDSQPVSNQTTEDYERPKSVPYA
jgi:hypothetical protein